MNRKVKALIVLCAAGLLVLSVLLVGCSPKASEDASASVGQLPIAEFTWTNDTDCSTCHAAESASLSDSSTSASVHGGEVEGCVTCHTDEAGLASAHEGSTPEAVKKATKLRKTSIDEQTCLACHESNAALAAKTADSTVLTDSQGTVVNPHALPETKDHADTNCASCHVMHRDEPASESAPAYCQACHHSNAYECNTCHA